MSSIRSLLNTSFFWSTHLTLAFVFVFASCSVSKVSEDERELSELEEMIDSEPEDTLVISEEDKEEFVEEDEDEENDEEVIFEDTKKHQLINPPPFLKSRPR